MGILMVSGLTELQSCPLVQDVRFGSLADILRLRGHVRFTPKSGHCSPGLTSRAKNLGNSKYVWRSRELYSEQGNSTTYSVKLF